MWKFALNSIKKFHAEISSNIFFNWSLSNSALNHWLLTSRKYPCLDSKQISLRINSEREGSCKLYTSTKISSRRMDWIRFYLLTVIIDKQMKKWIERSTYIRINSLGCVNTQVLSFLMNEKKILHVEECFHSFFGWWGGVYVVYSALE